MKSETIKINGLRNLLEKAARQNGFVPPLSEGSEMENTFFTKSVKNSKLYIGLAITGNDGKPDEFTANGGDFKDWCGDHYDTVCEFLSDDEMRLNLEMFRFYNDSRGPSIQPVVPKTEDKPEDKPKAKKTKKA